MLAIPLFCGLAVPFFLGCQSGRLKAFRQEECGEALTDRGNEQLLTCLGQRAAPKTVWISVLFQAPGGSVFCNLVLLT